MATPDANRLPLTGPGYQAHGNAITDLEIHPLSGHLGARKPLVSLSMTVQASSNGDASTSSLFRFSGRFSCRRSGWLHHQGVDFRQTSGESPPSRPTP
jgi:hypothetical protein